MNPGPGRLRIFLVLAALFAFAGCTSGFVYNRLDTVARWYIGSLVTLDDSQQAALRDWLGRSLAWHRGSELERYEEFLRDLSDQVAKGPDPALPAQLVDQAETLFQDLAGRLAPEAAELLVSLKPVQADELLANLKKRDDEELEEERDRTEADRQKRRVRSLTRQLERWTGSSTPEQKAIIERTVADMSAAELLGEDEEWYASQEAWRGRLRDLLAEGDATAVEGLLRDRSLSHTPAHAEEEVAERRHFLGLAAELDASLTGKQRATLARKLIDVAEDLKALQAG